MKRPLKSLDKTEELKKLEKEKKEIQIEKESIRIEREKLQKDRYDLHKRMIKRTLSGYTNKSNENWWIFGFYYMNATEVLIEKLNLINTSTDEKEINRVRTMITPTLYLFKHTLELILKFIYITFNEDLKNDHDLLAIYKKLDYEFISSRIDWKKHNTITSVPIETSKLNLKLQFSELGTLVERYMFHFGLIFNMTAGDYFIVDTENEMYKYPLTNKVKFQVDPIVANKIPNHEIKNLSEDFTKLQVIMNTFVSYLDYVTPKFL